MALNCFRDKSTQRGITMTTTDRSVFSIKMVKQDDNFNEADDYEDKQQILNAIADENEELLTNSNPSDYKESQV